MDSLSNKVNNDTIKFVNKTYKKLSIINSERSYLPTKNLYDDNIENNTDLKSIESILKQLKKGKEVFINYCDTLEKYTKPPISKFTEASLIKKLD